MCLKMGFFNALSELMKNLFIFLNWKIDNFKNIFNDSKQNFIEIYELIRVLTI